MSAGLFAVPLSAESVRGLHQPVEILRDRWGVAHIYAANSHDLFFAQGYLAARDRLFQLDLWRRAGAGKLSEVLGPSALPRDRIARAVLYRGDWNLEWASYSPDTRAIVTAFVAGINAYIDSLHGRRTPEFQLAGYDPARWVPEDCLSRAASLAVTQNLQLELRRAMQVRRLGLAKVQRFFPPDPNVPLEVPHGLNLNDLAPGILGDYDAAQESAGAGDSAGSNNWVIDGKLSATGRPMLASDPHRALLVPSLRRTVHLVAPGWNVIGAGEPALPGVAIGHNSHIAFGLTIAGFDQQDLYVETVNPANSDEYRYRGAWKRFRIERQSIAVKGKNPQPFTLKLTVHGPVIYEDLGKHRAYALRWAGSEPGTAGYLGSLALDRANSWTEFLAAASRFRIPSENLVYADTAGNIGWIAAGLAPVRKTWTGLLPVPGDSGEYEWRGFRKTAELPREFNPARHYIATANNNMLPPGYKVPLSYEWATPFRIDRIREMLSGGHRFDVGDFERMQQDVVSIPGRRLQAIARKVRPDASGTAKRALDEFLAWDCRVTAESRPALLLNVWMTHIAHAGFGEEIAPWADAGMVLKALEANPDRRLLANSLRSAVQQLEENLGGRYDTWRWGRIHQLFLRHPLNQKAWNLGPIERPGDANTVNAAAGMNYRQSEGASWREVIDVGDWDRSAITNAPGESGNPYDPHYRDLLDGWAAGRYHPLPFSRKAVESSVEERLVLKP
jgi:penicillin amidase